MNQRSSFVYSLACCATLLLGIGTGRASSPSEDPDFTEEYFWREDDVALVRVTEAPLKDAAVSTLTLQTKQTYSGPKGWADKSLPLSRIWFGWDVKARKAKVVTIEKGDTLLLWQMHDNDFIGGMKVAEPLAENPLIKTIEAIAKVRAAASETALKKACSSDDSAVVHYALLQLAALRSQKADADFAGRLITLRDEKSRPLSVRFEANRLLPNYSAKADQARTEAWKWARRVFESAKAESCIHLTEVLPDVMAAFPNRDDRVTYFSNLIDDETKPDPVRLASVSALLDEQCFDYKDATSDAASKDFSALLSLLKSKNGEFRKNALNVYFVCTRIPSDKSRIIRIKEAQAAVSAAIEQERDASVKSYMIAYLHHLERAKTDNVSAWRAAQRTTKPAK
jgi:hypothetical protein